MMTPSVAYLLTWIGLSLWYFAYWNQRPNFTKVFVVVGTFLLAVCLLNALGVLK